MRRINSYPFGSHCPTALMKAKMEVMRRPMLWWNREQHPARPRQRKSPQQRRRFQQQRAIPLRVVTPILELYLHHRPLSRRLSIRTDPGLVKKYLQRRPLRRAQPPRLSPLQRW
ncbi:unnamed protein product [Amoebophrya sp. A25]|nr:unnamed protein product [Amoebophrya sp. A25]|eukprot:GSA25T00000405001.1